MPVYRNAALHARLVDQGGTVHNILGEKYRYRAFGDGTHDDTDSIAAVLEDASTAMTRSGLPPGSLEVLIPPTQGGYLVNGQLTIPPYVTLVGSQAAAVHRGGRSFAQTTAQGRPGTVLIMGYASAGLDSTASADAWITVQRGAALVGMTLSDPANAADATPTAKPWCVALVAGSVSAGNSGASVRNVYLDCVYRGVLIDHCDKGQVDGLSGYPLKTGFQIDGVADVVDLANIRFYPAGTRQWDGTGVLDAWVLANGTSYRIGRCDGLAASRIFSFGYGVGLELFQGSDGINPFGQITDLKIDGSRIGLWVRAVALTGFRIVGCSIWSNHAPDPLPIKWDLAEAPPQQNGLLQIVAPSLKGGPAGAVSPEAESQNLVRILPNANVQSATDGAMSSSVNPTFLDSATFGFAATDVGLVVSVAGAGAAGATLWSTVASFTSATRVVLADAASTTVTGAAIAVYGSVQQKGRLSLVAPRFYQWGTTSADAAIKHSNAGVDLDVVSPDWIQASGVALDVADLGAADLNKVSLVGAMNSQSLPTEKVRFSTSVFTATTTTTAVAVVGPRTVTLTSAAGARVGMSLRFASGAADQEDVVLTAVSGNDVSAIFAKAHLIGVAVAGTRKLIAESYTTGAVMGPTFRRVNVYDASNTGTGAVLFLTGDTGGITPATPSKALRVTNNGQLQVLNDAADAALFVVSDAGVLTAGGGAGSALRRQVTSYATSGALTISDGIHKITKNSALAAMTLADPTAAQEGTTMTIVSQTAFAHTVTNATGFNGGGGASDVATFGGAIGDQLEITAINLQWVVKVLRNVTLG